MTKGRKRITNMMKVIKDNKYDESDAPKVRHIDEIIINVPFLNKK